MSLPTSIIKDIKGTSAYDWAEHSGLNWDATKEALHYFPEDGVSRESSMVSVVRSDTGQELGVVSKKYEIVQPKEILAGFESAVHDLGMGFDMDGIGLFGNGEIIWGRASSDQTIRIQGQDSLKSYLYMVTSFNGSCSTMGFVSTLREVCSNALHIASKRGDKLFNLSHRSKYKGQTISALDTYMERINTFENDVNTMAYTRMSHDDVKRFYRTMLYSNHTEYSKREDATVQKYIDSAKTGKGFDLSSIGLDDDGMSLWGVVNGVTNIIDNAPVRKAANDDGKTSFLGSGNAMKNKAWNQALKMTA